MATKKKAAKPAKKTIAPKKAVAAKKPAAKPAGKVSKPAVKAAPKAAVKPTAPKPPAKANGAKAAPEKKVVAKVAVPVKPVAKAPIKPEPKPLAKKPVPEPVKVEKKPEVPKEEVKKPEPVAPPPPPKKPVVPAKPVKVVIPEIKTKTVRKYEPEFTKSVLDQPENIQTGPTMRYSDAELGEFRELIQKKLDQAKKELSYLQGLITRKDEMGGDETENRYMTMEDGSMSMEREQLAQMASRQINYIDHLEKAMMRIENKTYGICRVTGKLIDKARLRAVPHATLSIEAKQMMNK
ncbi:TraR/DksA C4-type zinc finger protein [Paraflavitalea sp. CAU 1676]|uniref:TraR/DksA family transcriptional regulator n=1 Tax=Paraflavitalea sp. CAU 1676 TaxID=3032598 RepID=UPI0023DB41A2|nr:TraR/DksA C4-type zinc finger protein [Paraflavitalea sp. CAU 1676]MDF2187094.1 TraR/DksA C4-type zinc finger protein [Paraflavitalea sp. CAU 1676]